MSLLQEGSSPTVYERDVYRHAYTRWGLALLSQSGSAADIRCIHGYVQLTYVYAHASTALASLKIFSLINDNFTHRTA